MTEAEHRQAPRRRGSRHGKHPNDHGAAERVEGATESARTDASYATKEAGTNKRAASGACNDGGPAANTAFGTSRVAADQASTMDAAAAAPKAVPAAALPPASGETASSSAAYQVPQRTSNVGTYVVLTCVVALLALTMLGSLLNVGDHLMAANVVLGWMFYGLIGVVVVVGIIAPLVKIARRPIFSLYQLRDEKGRAKQRRCRMLVDNLIANTDLTDEEVLELQGYLQRGDKTDDLLISFFSKHCLPQIDDATKRAATTAFLIAAVSRSPLISTVTMLSICLDLVRNIVETCGFRPTNVGLARLYTRVMISALIIGGIEDADLGDLLGQLMGGGAGARAGGLFIGATAEGLVSAFLVFRVGVIAKKWLSAADGPARMSAIRRASYREALTQMRTSGFMNTVAEAVKDTSASVASSMASSVANAAKSTVGNARRTAHATVEQAKAAFIHTWGNPHK